MALNSAVVGAQRIGTDQFGQAVGRVDLGQASRAHFVEHHPDPGPGQLPSRLAARQAAADDVHGGKVVIDTRH